jgi:hypothetical protein
MGYMTIAAATAATGVGGRDREHTVHLAGAPAGVRITRTGPRRFQLRVRTSTVLAPQVVTVAVRRARARVTGGLEARTPDRVRAAVETATQLLWERYGDPVQVEMGVASPVRAVCRRTEIDGVVVHRVRVASAALAGHHVAEIRADGTITYPPGRWVPAPVIAAVEDVAARLCARAGFPVLEEVA